MMRFLRSKVPALYQLFKYGTPNINSTAHWDAAWSHHGTDEFRATGLSQEQRKRLLEVVPMFRKVLDAGCGCGEIMELVAKARACECCGLDIAPSAVARVTERGMMAKVSTLPAVPYPDDSFDVVICLEVLEHVPHPAKAIREFQRVLRPNGTLIVTVPIGERDEDGSHLHRFSEKGIRSLVGARFRVAGCEELTADDPMYLVTAHA
jgi:ubiquinone/menaquinone biosynthesis C-methylase UbiE